MSDSLRPASYGDPQKSHGFGPKMPWLGLSLGLLTLVSLVGFYFYNEARKADEVRERIHRMFAESMGPAASDIRRFRERIEGWVLEAASADEIGTGAKTGFELNDLRSLRGVYLRIDIDDARDVETLRMAAATMTPDAIGRCMGISPVSLRGFYERSRFLDEGFLERATEPEDVLRLRVMEEQMRNHLERDLPLITVTAESDYFLLVLSRGDGRRGSLADVYLWDLRPEHGELLLRTRTEARGVLVTARIALPGSPYNTLAPASPRRQGAQDCSIGSQVRAATGAAPVEFASDVAEPPPELLSEPEFEPTASDADADDGASTRAGEGERAPSG